MKRIVFYRSAALVLACLFVLFAFCACDRSPEGNRELFDEFLSSAMDDNYDAAYALIKEAVSDAEFKNYWRAMQYVVGGASTYTVKQTGFQLNSKNGVTVCYTYYKVSFDNGRTAVFRLVTHSEYEGIAGIHCSEVTDFLADTKRTVTLGTIATVILSALSIGFAVWMIVDCVRRKLKRKVLWIILILFSIGLKLTLGEELGILFKFGFFSHYSSIVADPFAKSIVISIFAPVGAIIYFFLRKKHTVVPEPPVEITEPMEDTVNE